MNRIFMKQISSGKLIYLTGRIFELATISSNLDLYTGKSHKQRETLHVFQNLCFLETKTNISKNQATYKKN